MWGIEESPTTINVNGQPLTVSGSLLEVLRDLRCERKDRALWINSICINQNDREEKGGQLERMVEALSNAAGYISRTWDATKNKYALNDTKPNPWLISGTTSIPPAPNAALSEIGGIESEHSLGITDCQLYFESPPALVSSPGSPQTDSTSSSPESNAGFHIQTSSMGAFPFPFGTSGSWTDNMDGSGHDRLSLGGEVMMKTATTSKCKRSLATAFSDEPTILYHQRPKKIQRTTEGVNDRGSSLVFACPFQKSNPEKYHRCLKYTLNRIKDVKQHIYRQHMQPPLYCARCYKVFGSTGDRDEHTRRAQCGNQEPPQFEGISELQRIELKKSSPKKKSLQEQWFEVWDVIFPGRQRPQSASIGNYVEEMVPLLRDLWNKRRMEIISDVIDSRSGRDGIDNQLLADVMSSVFDRFEAETTRSCQVTSTEGTGSPAFRSLPYATQDSDFSFEIESSFDQHGLQHMAVPNFDTGCAIDLDTYYFSQNL